MSNVVPNLDTKLGTLQGLVNRGRAGASEKEGDILLVARSSIRPGVHQPRTAFPKESLAEMARTIKRDGITTPLQVRRLPDGNFELLAGERRWRAAKEAGLTTVPVIVRNLDEAASRRLALVDNLQREDLSLFDEIKAVGRLVAELGSVKAVADELCKSLQWVSKRAILADAHPLVSELLESGRSADADGLLELHRLAQRDEDAAKRAIAEFEDGSSLRNHLKRVASNPSPEKTSSKDAADAAKSDNVIRRVRQSNGAVFVPKLTVANGCLVHETHLGPIEVRYGSAALATLTKAISRLLPFEDDTGSEKPAKRSEKSKKGRGASRR
jgi:ParB family chromosome partitioning protein